MTKPKIIAHRGSSATCLENTMAAFRQAAADRADGIEFDLRLSADRQWVVHHNPDALVGGVPMRLSRLTLAEIIQLPIGSGKERIPTLAEFLEWAGSQPGSLVFDIKDTDGIPELVSALAQHASPRIILSSFNRSVLRELRKLRPEWPRALIVDDPRWKMMQKLLSRWLVRSATDGEMTALHLHQRWITPSLITAAKSAGIEIAVWTVDDPARISMLSWLGVNSIITNDPALARQIVGGLNLSRVDSAGV
ncbi:MAG: glycerophosphodiester phosphodiesterase [candidate division Zixibacteria bacterium]|nr:glycerophosphodiester phosphodiesterase [candidate division Zixibacteria bacterium]